MATPLNTTLIGHFDIIFPFLLVLVLSYALLTKFNIFKSKSINSLLAFVLAVMMLTSTIARETLNTAAPWFILLFVFIVFILMSYMGFGATEGDIASVLKSPGYSYINLWIIAIVLVIIFGSLTSTISKYGGIGNTDSGSEITSPDVSSDSSGTITSPGTTSSTSVSTSNASQESDFWSTLVNPNVLGMILILLIAVFTMQRLVKD